MNIKKHQELIDLTDYLAVSNKSLIRNFKEGGNYLIIDTLGDFLIIERDEVETVFSKVWRYFYGVVTEDTTNTLNSPSIGENK